MAIEVEQKFRVDAVSSLTERLSKLGAEPATSEIQVDAYFAHPSRDFAITDEALRIRRVGDDNYITYKGPKLDASTKTRREIEIELPQGDQGFSEIAALLQALAFQPVLEVRKHRQHFKLAWQGQPITISLDHIEGLGDFVELEVLADENSMQQALAVVASLADELHLRNGERRSYLELLLAQK